MVYLEGEDCCVLVMAVVYLVEHRYSLLAQASEEAAYQVQGWNDSVTAIDDLVVTQDYFLSHYDQERDLIELVKATDDLAVNLNCCCFSQGSQEAV